jgi:hypothetical protein
MDGIIIEGSKNQVYLRNPSITPNIADKIAE